MTRPVTPGLSTLARRYGIQPSYFSVRGQRIRAPEETLRHLLNALGVSARNAIEVRNALRAEALARMETPVEPVIVAWDGNLPNIEVHHSGHWKQAMLTIALEDNPAGAGSSYSLHRATERDTRVDGRTFRISEYHCDKPLPPGYHTLRWEVGPTKGDSLVISAPPRCYAPAAAADNWGIFVPLYALRSDTDWGAGSYGELERLSRWVHSNGGDLVSTLPILPCFYDRYSESSPYLPVTRLLWSEFFVDVDSIGFISECDEAATILSGDHLTQERTRLHQADLVDYPAVLSLKRRALKALAHFARHQSTTLSDEIDTFLRSHPLARDYAAFRGALEAAGRRWQDWPELLRLGDLSSADINLETQEYHEFVQWLAHRQIRAMTDSADTASLYLDLPIGVHPEGYDAWRYQKCHLTGVSCGAPPDTVFTTGQNWVAPPLHPTTLRADVCHYWRLCLQHHMQQCNLLRIDHVMGLHRMFCIPAGASASEGTYIHFRPEERYAVLTLESQRNRTAVVGEDLGTVPHEVRRQMARHGLNRMFVLYYELPRMAASKGLGIPRNSLACISTHDMPPFAAIWRGVDIREQATAGIIEKDHVRYACSERKDLKERLKVWLRLRTPEQPADDETSILRSMLSWLAASRARYVIANLEDFWFETRQANMPGAGGRYPNWVQRMAKTLEQIQDNTQISDMIGILRVERTHRRRARMGDSR